MIIRQKIAVTGANGQLGKELRQIASLYPQFEFCLRNRAELSIEKEEQLKNFFLTEKPQYLVNAAAYTAVDKAEQEKELAFLINATAVGNLASICDEIGCRMIHISSDYVFDGNSRAPYLETDNVNPVSVYGESKLKGEQLAMGGNADVIIIRSSWVYSEFGNNFVKTMIRLMSEKKEINVVNDQKGCPTYAADLAEAILTVISGNKWIPGIYNYSNKGEITWFEFASQIKNLTGSSCIIHPITTSQYPTPAKRPAWSVLDNSKIFEHYQILPKYWKESLKVCLHRLELETSIN